MIRIENSIPQQGRTTDVRNYDIYSSTLNTIDCALDESVTNNANN